MLTQAARAVVQTIAIATLPAVAAAAPADPGPAEPIRIAWQCVQEFDEAFHVLCVPGLVDSATPPVPEPTSGTAPGRIGADMRPVAQRGESEVFSASAWRVPLHARPTDRAVVETLLKSVLCGAHPACGVDYGKPTLRVAGR